MLRFVDGFDHYLTVAKGLRKGWTSWGTINGVTGRFGGRAIQTYNGDHFILPLDAQSTWIVGFAWYTAGGYLSSEQKVFTLLDNATEQVYLSITTDNKWKVYNGSTTLLATGTTAMALTSWYYIEFKVTIHDTTGSFELRIEGVSEVSGSNVDTKNSANTTADKIKIFGHGIAVYTCVDDLYIADSQAGQITDFIGPCRIDTLYPTSDGSLTDWTASAGSRYACIDENDPNDATDYIYESVAGEYSTFNLGNLSSSGVSVKGVQINVTHQKDDATSRSIAPVIRQSAVNADGSTVVNNSSWAQLKQLYETNPVTTIAWTQADVDTNAEFGVKVVA